MFLDSPLCLSKVSLNTDFQHRQPPSQQGFVGNIFGTGFRSRNYDFSGGHPRGYARPVNKIPRLPSLSPDSSCNHPTATSPRTTCIRSADDVSRWTANSSSARPLLTECSTTLLGQSQRPWFSGSNDLDLHFFFFFFLLMAIIKNLNSPSNWILHTDFFLIKNRCNFTLVIKLDIKSTFNSPVDCSVKPSVAILKF